MQSLRPRPCKPFVLLLNLTVRNVNRGKHPCQNTSCSLMTVRPAGKLLGFL